MKRDHDLPVFLALLACGGCAPASATGVPGVVVAVPAAPSGAGPAGSGPAGQPARQFRCQVAVRVFGAEVVGSATGNDGATVAAAAEQDACRKLWERERIDCHDEARVATLRRSSQLSIVDGKASYSAEVVLRSIGSTVSGTGSSDESGPAACEHAVDDACVKAPPASECSGVGLACRPQPGQPTSWTCSYGPPPATPARTPSPFEA